LLLGNLNINRNICNIVTTKQPVNYMSEAAHHNDLRLPAEGDPESVV